jgi:endoglucanase
MSIIVMVTNLCPNNGNEQWCPAVGGTNQYGFSYHFDIMAQSEVFGDNPVVEFEPVPCPGQAISDFETCVCNGQTASDETPAGIAAAASAASPSPVAASSPAAVNSLPAAAPPANSSPAAAPQANSSPAAAPAPSPVANPAPVKALSTLSTAVKASGTAAVDPETSPKEHGGHKEKACAVPH